VNTRLDLQAVPIHPERDPVLSVLESRLRYVCWRTERRTVCA
jgi:hypothetical protein